MSEIVVDYLTSFILSLLQSVVKLLPPSIQAEFLHPNVEETVPKTLLSFKSDVAFSISQPPRIFNSYKLFKHLNLTFLSGANRDCPQQCLFGKGRLHCFPQVAVSRED